MVRCGKRFKTIFDTTKTEKCYDTIWFGTGTVASSSALIIAQVMFGFLLDYRKSPKSMGFA